MLSDASDELAGRYGSSLAFVPGTWFRYICIVGATPSGGVLMLALSMWLPSGRPPSVFAAVEHVQQDRVAAVCLEVAHLRP